MTKTYCECSDSYVEFGTCKCKPASTSSCSFCGKSVGDIRSIHTGSGNSGSCRDCYDHITGGVSFAPKFDDLKKVKTMSDVNIEEFTKRFTAEAKRLAGFETFDDGMTVDDYCKDVAASYFADPLYREDGPEACAESDVSYWGEE